MLVEFFENKDIHQLKADINEWMAAENIGKNAIIYVTQSSIPKNKPDHNYQGTTIVGIWYTVV